MLVMEVLKNWFGSFTGFSGNSIAMGIKYMITSKKDFHTTQKKKRIGTQRGKQFSLQN